MGAKMTRGVPFAVKRWAARLVLALPWVVAGALIAYTFPKGDITAVPGSIVVSPSLAVTLWCERVLFAVSCVNIVFLGYRTVARRSLAWGLFAGVSLLVLPLAGLFSLLSLGLGCWSDLSRLQVQGGRTYHWLRMGEGEALAVEVSQGVFLQAKVIGVNDNERGYYAIVRPGGVARYALKPGRSPGGVIHRSHLAESRDRRWVLSLAAYDTYPGNKKGCATNLVYDQTRALFWTQEDLYKLSPFLLVRPDDKLEKADIEALLVRGQEYVQGCSDLGVLRRESANPNPAVRAVVAQLLAQTPGWGQEADVALARGVLEQMAKEDVNSDVRKAARGALSGLRSSVQQRAK